MNFLADRTQSAYGSDAETYSSTDISFRHQATVLKHRIRKDLVALNRYPELESGIHLFSKPDVRTLYSF